MVLKELEDQLSGFTTGRCNLNNICFADDMLLMADSERKLEELYTVDRSKDKWLLIVRKCKVIIKKQIK